MSRGFCFTTENILTNKNRKKKIKIHKMKFNLTIPVSQYYAISEAVKQKFIALTPKQEKRIIEECYSLFIFINDFRDDTDEYKHIYHSHLKHFRFDISKKCYHHTDIIEILELANQINVYKTPYIDESVMELKYKQSYKTGEFTKAYKIVENKYTNDNKRDIEIDLNHVFSNQKSYSELLKTVEDDRILKNTIENFDKKKVNLDSLKNFLLKHENEKVKETKTVKCKNGEYKTFKKTVILDSNKINEIIIQSAKINESLFFVSRSQEGRIYSSFSNLNKLAIPFVEDKIGFKNRLVELDVTNCQPLLLAYLFKSKFFKELVESGQFYEFFEKYGIDRDSFKAINMVILFGNTLLSDRNRKLLKDIEGLADFLDSFRNKKLRSAKLFHKLQKMESRIFCEILAQFCLDNNINYFTRHDSIMVDKDDAKRIEKLLKQSFKNEFGLNATIKTKSQVKLLEDLELKFEYIKLKDKEKENKLKTKNK